MISNRIALLAKKEHLTSSQLGNILGLSAQSANAKMNGVVRWTVNDILRLAKHFNVSTDYLLGLTSPEQPVEVVSA